MFPEPYTIVGVPGVPGSEQVVTCPTSSGTPLGAFCQPATWGVEVDIWVVNNMPVDGFVNVLMDWNQDGAWANDPGTTCPTGAVPEHVLVDFPVPVGYAGPLSVLGPPGFMIGPNTGYVWTRFTISEDQLFTDDWTGEGIFEDGETEDYLLEVAAPGSTIGDLVWWDVNGDGIQDPTEPGIPNVDMVLTDGMALSTTTNPSGLYSFTGLAADTYTVTVQGYEFGAGGTLENWFATNPSPPLWNVTVGAAQTVLTADFGMDIDSSYSIEKVLNSVEPLRVGDPVSFTIRIENTGDTTITELPMSDDYDTSYLYYNYAVPASVNNDNDGTINWSDLAAAADLAPGDIVEVTVWFTAWADTSALLPDGKTANTAILDGAEVDPDGPLNPLPPAEPPMPREEAEARVEITQPTGEVMHSFSATADGYDAVINWESANEANILGYNVFRTPKGSTEWEQVNGELIAATESGADRGASYEYTDENLADGIYWYRLEIVMLDGTGPEPYGIDEVVIGRSYIFLPFVVR
jgi:hypothetical protein